MTKEALKLALEVLEQTLQTLDDENAKPGGAIADTIWHSKHETLFDYLGSKITAIKEVLAPTSTQCEVQPEQDSVAWPCEIETADFEEDTVTLKMQSKDYFVGVGLHWLSTTPPKRPWVGLPDENVKEIWLKGKDHGDDWLDVLALARSFEAELKQKNT